MKKWNEQQLKNFYKHRYPAGDYLTKMHTEHFYPFVENLNCKSGFEFGCNMGKNLKNLKFKETAGVDISKRAIDKALVKGLICGDESRLSEVPDNSYDIVFTCSVLCHIDNIDGIVEHLKRISKKHILFVESLSNGFNNHFPHNYEKMGFEKVFSHPTPKKIIYNGYYACLHSKS